MSTVPYDVLQLMNKITKTGGQGDVLEDFIELMNTVYAYGSEKAISLYTLLATQVKFDVTGIAVSPELWLQMKLNDYSSNKNEFKKANNKLVEELDLNNMFKIM